MPIRIYSIRTYWVVAKIGPDGFCPIPDLVQIWSRSGPDRGTWLSRSKNLDGMSGHAVVEETGKKLFFGGEMGPALPCKCNEND